MKFLDACPSISPVSENHDHPPSQPAQNHRLGSMSEQCTSGPQPRWMEWFWGPDQPRWMEWFWGPQPISIEWFWGPGIGIYLPV